MKREAGGAAGARCAACAVAGGGGAMRGGARARGLLSLVALKAQIGERCWKYVVFLRKTQDAQVDGLLAISY